MRRRRKVTVEHDNHERWLVSYADFITLLFAFFVVMYSISSVNEGKYKTLSNALGDAFSNKAVEVNEKQYDKPVPIDHTLQPISLETTPTTIQPIELPHPSREELDKKNQLSEEILKERRNLVAASEQFKEALSPFIEENLVKVKKNDFWVELEMNSELLFASGEADLAEKAIPVINKVAEIVKAMPNAINVEGHTDDKPIKNIKYLSNWELSAARAASVVRQLIEQKVEASRMSAIGYGEFHPIADNQTEEGRFQNRRVVIVLMSHAFARYGANDEERAKLLNFAPLADKAGTASMNAPFINR